MEYKAYIKSKEWKALRIFVLDRDRHTCRQCGIHRKLCVHHLSYPKVLGTESPDTLVTLCEDCHNLVHGGVSAILQPNKPRRKKKAKRKKYVPICKVYTQAEIVEYQVTLK